MSLTPRDPRRRAVITGLAALAAAPAGFAQDAPPTTRASIGGMGERFFREMIG